MRLSEKELKILRNLERMGGTGPDRPLLSPRWKPQAARLMQMGLIELVKPPPEGRLPGRALDIPYARLTSAGRVALEDSDGHG